MKKNPGFTVNNFLIKKNSTYTEVKEKKNIRLKILVCISDNDANVRSNVLYWMLMNNKVHVTYVF